MTNQALPHASPALTALLQEMDESPKSTLFGITPNQLVKGMRGNIDTISARQAGLSNLEEYLLEAHREELALVLAAGAHTRMHKESVLGVPLLTWTRYDHAVDLDYSDILGHPYRAEYPSRVRRAMQPFGGLQGLCHGGRSSILALLSCRVLAMPHRRMILGTTMFVNGSYQSGRRCLLQSLKGDCATTTRRHALHNAAICAWRSKEDAMAIDLIAGATVGPEVPPSMWVDHIALAVRMHDSRALAFAASGLSDTIDEWHPAFREGVISTCAAIENKIRVLEPDTVRFARRLRGGLPGTAREFLNQTFCRDPKPFEPQ